jgi:hypothetical protein
MDAEEIQEALDILALAVTNHAAIDLNFTMNHNTVD